jgi:hypothetical protein
VIEDACRAAPDTERVMTMRLRWVVWVWACLNRQQRGVAGLRCGPWRGLAPARAADGGPGDVHAARRACALGGARHLPRGARPACCQALLR